ncbi:MAG: response regulator [Chloroflexi bacterium SZAS-1]|nr:response regulator [Chloroflexi bacterium SZAS-1]
MAHILLVEDAPDNRNIAELILLDAGHTVVSVGDGASALSAAASLQPDIILMDLSLPRLDGWEATRRLKQDPATRDIPVIAFTAHALPNDLDRARAVGCSAVIAKPFEIDTFLNQINGFIRPPLERSRGMDSSSALHPHSRNRK